MSANGERAKLVEKPLAFPPHTCIVTNRSDGEIIDFGADYVGVDPHIYIRRGTVEAVARKLLGMEPKSALRESDRQVKRLTAEVERLQALVDASDAISEARQSLKEALA